VTGIHGRLERARAALATAGAGALVVSVGPELPYLVGYRATPLERPTALVLTAGGATLVVPRLEEPRVRPDPAFALRGWRETEDPVAIVAELVGDARVVAVGEQARAGFLLALQEALPRVRFVPAGPVIGPLRLRKDPAEIEALAAAAAAADRVMDRLAAERFSARSERELARWIADRLLEEGHETVEFAIVAAGPNGASPHHEPTGRRVRRGDVVVVDFGGRRGGYCSDTTRTFFVGEVPPEVRRAYDALRRAQEAAVAAVRPGVPAERIDAAARRVLEEEGYGERFIHRVGHGIGLDPHEPPYLVAGATTPLAAGMTFSVEPGIYVPGAWGMRLEDIVVVTATGVRRLNDTDRAPRTVA